MKIHHYRDARRDFLIRRNLIAHSRRSRKYIKPISKDDIDRICKYLENPTKTGIWTLKTKWLKFGGISESIINKLKKEFDKNENIEITSGKRKVRINLKKLDQDDLIEETSRLTFIFNLFSYIIHQENQDESFINYLESEDSGEKLIFDIIDLEEIKKEYAEAIEYFKKHIYNDNLIPFVIPNNIIIIGNGFILLKDSDEDDEEFDLDDFKVDNDDIRKKEEIENICFVSIRAEPLEELKIFYEKLNKITDSNIIPIYSPEKEVFAPYFTLLEQAYNYLIDDENIRQRFRNSISEYDDENYSYCISTIGLILDDYLTRIYEILFRDVCPKDLGIGEIFKLIHDTINDKFKQTQEVIEDKSLYESINNLIKNPSDPSISIETLKIMRDILTYIKKDKKQKENTKSIFPRYLINNIKEAIRNRNAISHKSTFPIGRYEALRTVYCCITLIIWWTNEIKCIDWKKDSNEILKEVIERNSY